MKKIRLRFMTSFFIALITVSAAIIPALADEPTEAPNDPAIVVVQSFYLNGSGGIGNF